MGQQCIIWITSTEPTLPDNQYSRFVKVNLENDHVVPPSNRQKLAHAGFTVLLPYLLSKTEAWLTLSNELTPAIWKDRLQNLITNAETIFSTLSLLNFLTFLVNGR